MKTKKHILKILIVLPAIIPSAKIGVINPLMRLQKEKFCKVKIVLESQIARFWGSGFKQRELLSKFDVLVMCRNQSTLSLQLAYEARRQWIPLIYDIDDNFFDISLSSAIGRYHRNPLHLYQLEKLLQFSSIARVYANPMVEHMKRLSVDTEMVDSYFDTTLVSRLRANKKKSIRIAYPTSRTNDSLSQIFVVAAHKILKKYGDRVEFHFWGNIPGPLRRFSNVKTNKPIPKYEKFVKEFYEMNFDIGLAPLKDTIFHRSKTNNKFREYSGCGVAGIYSNVDVYSNCIENGKEGLLVENTEEEWFNAIESLILDETLRETIVDNSKRKLDERYSLEKNCKKWRNQILQVTSQNMSVFSSLKAPARPLMLATLSKAENFKENADIFLNTVGEVGFTDTYAVDSMGFDLNRSDTDWIISEKINKVRRIEEYKNISDTIGANFIDLDSEPKKLSQLNVEGVLIVIVSSIEMLELGLELRNKALAMVIDATPLVKPRQIDELKLRILQWSKLAPEVTFVVRNEIIQENEFGNNVFGVDDDLSETPNKYFSPKGRLYLLCEIVDSLAKNLSLAHQSGSNTLANKLSRRVGNHATRISNLMALLKITRI